MIEQINLQRANLLKKVDKYPKDLKEGLEERIQKLRIDQTLKESHELLHKLYSDTAHETVNTLQELNHESFYFSRTPNASLYELREIHFLSENSVISFDFGKFPSSVLTIKHAKKSSSVSMKLPFSIDSPLYPYPCFAPARIFMNSKNSLYAICHTQKKYSIFSCSILT
jgi:hypothetical protein